MACLLFGFSFAGFVGRLVGFGLRLFGLFGLSLAGFVDCLIQSAIGLQLFCRSEAGEAVGDQFAAN